MTTTTMMMESSEQVGAGAFPAFLLGRTSGGRKRPEVSWASVGPARGSQPSPSASAPERSRALWGELVAGGAAAGPQPLGCGGGESPGPVTGGRQGACGLLWAARFAIYEGTALRVTGSALVGSLGGQRSSSLPSWLCGSCIPWSGSLVLAWFSVPPIILCLTVVLNWPGSAPCGQPRPCWTPHR